jgi:hypothetical protein
VSGLNRHAEGLRTYGVAYPFPPTPAVHGSKSQEQRFLSVLTCDLSSQFSYKAFQRVLTFSLYKGNFTSSSFIINFSKTKPRNRIFNNSMSNTVVKLNIIKCGKDGKAVGRGMGL